MAGVYCARCGQPAADPDPTLRSFVWEAMHELTSLDGKVIRTLATLFSRPGQLTVDVIAGRRARWLPPLRVYLICSLIFFAGREAVERFTGRSAPEVARVSLGETSRPGQLTPEERRTIAEGLPGRVFGVERLERAARDQQGLNRAIRNASSHAMFVLLPVFAALTWVAWHGARRRYPAHLYVAMHLHAAWFCLLLVFFAGVALAPSPAAAVILGLATLIVIASHTLLAFRRIFGQSWPQTLLRSAAVAAVYSGLLLATSLVMLGIAILTM